MISPAILSWVDVVTNGQSAYPSWVSGTPLGPMTRFLFSFPLPDNCFALRFGHPLWQEDGSVICSAICQWLELQRPHNHTLLSHLRLGSLSVASYNWQELRWKYSNPPPHGDSSNLGIFSIWYNMDHMENTMPNSYSIKSSVFWDITPNHFTHGDWAPVPIA
jgi:hypothetical protein